MFAAKIKRSIKKSRDAITHRGFFCSIERVFTAYQNVER